MSSAPQKAKSRATSLWRLSLREISFTADVPVSRMAIPRIAVGSPAETSHPDTLRAALAEFISMLIFVFAGEGSGMAFSMITDLCTLNLTFDYFNFLFLISSNERFIFPFFLWWSGKLTDGGAATPAGLVAAALSHGLALFVAVSVGANISGGHVNPAVTFGLFLGGKISLAKSVIYWIAQCLGAVVACLLLSFSTGGLVCVFLSCNILVVNDRLAKTNPYWITGLKQPIQLRTKIRQLNFDPSKLIQHKWNWLHFPDKTIRKANYNTNVASNLSRTQSDKQSRALPEKFVY